MLSFSVTEIVDNFQLAPSTVSHHLQRLRRCGLVDVQRAGKERLYRLRLDNLRKSVGQFYDSLNLIDAATERVREREASQ